MNLLAYLQRYSGYKEASRALLFLTDWCHTIQTGLQATRLRWERRGTDILYEGALATEAEGSVWEAAEAVLEETRSLSADEVRQHLFQSYPLLTTEPFGPLDLPQLGRAFHDDLRLLRQSQQGPATSRYERLSSPGDVI